MKYYYFLLLCLFSIAGNSQSLKKVERSYAFRGVNVVDVQAGSIVANTTVLVRNGKIVEVGRNKQKLPKGTVVLDAQGKFVMPGMYDMHAHFPNVDGEPFPVDDYLFLNLSRGITSLRVMRGAPVVLDWKQKIQNEDVIGPSLFVGSPALVVDEKLQKQDLRTLLEGYQHDGYDFIKYLGGNNQAVYDSINKIAKRIGIKVAGHGPPMGLEAAVNASQSSVEHIEPFIGLYLYDSTRYATAMNTFVEKGLWSCPDLYWYLIYGYQIPKPKLLTSPGIEYVSKDMVARWEKDLYGIDSAALKRKYDSYSLRINAYKKLLSHKEGQGVKLLVSPGDGAFIIPGYSYLEEMKLFAQSGISNANILRACTYNAAQYFGDDNLGKIEANQSADIVLLDANPLLDITNVTKISGVMVRGRWFSKKELDEKLSAIKKKYTN
ncbi:amidohydrolase family protein [Hymenobacter actinosclerus]|uniref:Cytosine/adenosine deaminase n=1 Tax=Hymenobacter actinosclerus TaxID=82805 RepID=A0A1I0IKM7_9BACT|nr:amidohydrolase family protein [Hymenobacter actinosclerus]SET97552.1 Cytosine/adenosine deaminase [Hymenobacter actinosclerus]